MDKKKVSNLTDTNQKGYYKHAWQILYFDVI